MACSRSYSYPTDCTEEEWAFVTPYLTLLPQDAGAGSDRFLLGRGRPLNAADISNIMRRITVNHLVRNDATDTGIRGVTRELPLRFFRHVLATGTWKRSRDAQMAADAIADSVDVVRDHYGRYVPDDRRERLETIIGSGLAANFDGRPGNR